MVAGIPTRILTAVTLVGLAAACEQPGPLVPLDDTTDFAAAVTLPAALTNEAWVCKDAPGGSFSFTVSATSGTVLDANPTIAADACVKVATGPGLVTVTESDPSPYLFDKIEVWEIPLPPPGSGPLPPVLVATQTPLDRKSTWSIGDIGVIFVFYNTSPPGLCTLTPGYWKTHSEFGPAPYDATWASLPGGQGASTPFFSSGKTWHEAFWTSVSGNGYYNLAHHYMAARLNVLAGATTTTAVDAALAAAESLFGTYTPDQISILKGSDPLRQQFISAASTLAAYNEGLIGPGHCSDVDIPTDP